jgi:hypothetical protein
MHRHDGFADIGLKHAGSLEIFNFSSVLFVRGGC